MTVKCTFCNDTKQEPGIPGPCVWCEQVGTAPVAVGYQLAKGFTDPVGDCEKFEAGITVNAWLQRIVVYGDSPADAEALRDHIMSSAEREAALREELDNHDSVSQLMNAWVAEKGQMPWVTAINIMAIATKMPDEERQRLIDMDDGSTERGALVAERDALQQRLTVAEQRADRMDELLMTAKPLIPKGKFGSKTYQWHLEVSDALKPAAEGEGS